MVTLNARAAHEVVVVGYGLPRVGEQGNETGAAGAALLKQWLARARASDAGEVDADDDALRVPPAALLAHAHARLAPDVDVDGGGEEVFAFEDRATNERCAVARVAAPASAPVKGGRQRSAGARRPPATQLRVVRGRDGLQRPAEDLQLVASPGFEVDRGGGALAGVEDAFLAVDARLVTPPPAAAATPDSGADSDADAADAAATEAKAAAEAEGAKAVAEAKARATASSALEMRFGFVAAASADDGATAALPLVSEHGACVEATPRRAVRFGRRQVGQAHVETVTLRNASSRAAAWAAAVSGAAGADDVCAFAIEGGASGGVAAKGVLQPLACAQLRVVFSPDAQAPFRARLLLSGGDASGGALRPCARLALSGRGSDDIMEGLPPARLRFGCVPLGRARWLTTTLRNYGADAQRVVATATPPFAVAPARATVPPGARLRLSVGFVPAAEGTAVGEVNVFCGGQQTAVNCRGLGGAVAFNVSPPSRVLSFGCQRYGRVVAADVVVANLGALPLRLLQVQAGDEARPHLRVQLRALRRLGADEEREMRRDLAHRETVRARSAARATRMSAAVALSTVPQGRGGDSVAHASGVSTLDAFVAGSIAPSDGGTPRSTATAQRSASLWNLGDDTRAARAAAAARHHDGRRRVARAVHQGPLRKVARRAGGGRRGVRARARVQRGGADAPPPRLQHRLDAFAARRRRPARTPAARGGRRAARTCRCSCRSCCCCCRRR